jgi:hypothetical protein
MSQPLLHMPFNQKPTVEGAVLGLYPEVQKRPLSQAPGLNQTSGQAPDAYPLMACGMLNSSCFGRSAYRSIRHNLVLNLRC